ncbi:uncharacterized protein [Centruroides vittatus]|uniref:uncharacterized protein n=1 Tax=Centruroides vittatus TaxID=120091 RepID=UPI00350E9DB7
MLRNCRSILLTQNAVIAPDKLLEKLHNRVKRFAKSPLARLLRLDNIIMKAPRPPKIFAFGKTHKPGYQIRPVVEKCNAPTFALEKQLVRFIRDKIQDYPYCIKDSLQLVHRMNEIMLKDREHMTVMDFKALYPSIKLPPCFCALRDFLFNNIVNSFKYKRQILELADLICHSSFFEFQGKTYMQGRGVPMGSPISAMLCELVLRNLECNILPSFQEDIVFYTRYVDDIFIIWHNDRNTRRFLDAINSNPYGLTLELDQESDFRVNFLDLTITCKDGEIQTDIFRKPVYQPSIIPRNSVDPEQFKLAALRAWIQRAYTHCSSICDTYKELEYVRSVATQFGYQRRVVNRLITDIQRLYRLLRNDKRKEKPNELTGVYSIPIRDQRFKSDLVYIGATLRGLQQRIKEHKQSVKRTVDSTVLAAFAKQQEITVHWDSASIIKATRSKQAVRHLEKLEIYRAQLTSHCINHRDADGLSSAWKSFIG